LDFLLRCYHRPLIGGALGGNRTTTGVSIAIVSENDMPPVAWNRKRPSTPVLVKKNELCRPPWAFVIAASRERRKRSSPHWRSQHDVNLVPDRVISFCAAAFVMGLNFQ
jgi:hypothetical protein